MKKGFSAEYMASLLDVSCSAYYKYEGGKNNIPLNKAQQMSIILDCHLIHSSRYLKYHKKKVNK